MSGCDPRAPRPDEACWALYGLVLTTPMRFANRMATAPLPADGRADLWVRPVERSPLAAGWDDGPVAYRSPNQGADGTAFLEVLVTPEARVLRFVDVVDFFLFDDGIAVHAHDDAYAHMVELHLLGIVLAYWCERAGLLALHASSVVIEGRTAGFLANHGAGKSSLAATALQRGHALASDDVVVLEVDAVGIRARPGYPQMRMWPDAALRFVGRDDLALVHPLLTKRRVPIGLGGIGRFDDAVRPLSVLYLPTRDPTATSVGITPLGFGEAVFALARTSYLAGAVDDLGPQPARFAALAEVARRIPVRALRYPDGYTFLPDVWAEVERDVRATDVSAS